MSEKRSKIVYSFVEYYKCNYECERCLGGNVPNLTDSIIVADNNGFCLMCEHDRKKFIKD